MESTKSVIVLATKEQSTSDGKRKFNVYFAYRQELVDGEYRDILTPMQDENGSPTFKAKPIKVRLSEDFEKRLNELDLQFPLMMTLNPDKRIKNKEGKTVSSFFVTLDTDKDTKQPRLDKYGKKHLVLILRDAEDIKEKPHTEYSLDDLDDFE